MAMEWNSVHFLACTVGLLCSNGMSNHKNSPLSSKVTTEWSSAYQWIIINYFKVWELLVVSHFTMFGLY